MIVSGIFARQPDKTIPDAEFPPLALGGCQPPNPPFFNDAIDAEEVADAIHPLSPPCQSPPCQSPPCQLPPVEGGKMLLAGLVVFMLFLFGYVGYKIGAEKNGPCNCPKPCSCCPACPGK